MSAKEKVKNLDFLLIGKTGNGKSAAGNSILLDRKAFKSKNSTGSVTKKAQFDYSKFENTIIKVVDGPGIGDTELKGEAGVKLVVEAMTFAIQANPEGYHALLLVVRYGGRFTEEDMNTVKILKNIFGENFTQDHGVLVVTCGDNFRGDAEETGETFEEWCHTQDGVFANLLREFQGRVVLFDNKTKDERLRHQQLRRLLDVVDGLRAKGKRYTHELFQAAQKSREELLKASDEPQLTEEAIRDAGLITRELARVDYSNPTDEMKRIEMVMAEVEKLQKLILRQDKGTDKLSEATDLAKTMKATATDQLAELKDFAAMQEKMQEMEKRLQEANRQREKERKKEEKRREKEKQDEELKRQKEELQKERDKLAKEREREREKKVERLEDKYSKVKENETQGWFDALAPAGRKLWDTAASWLPW